MAPSRTVCRAAVLAALIGCAPPPAPPAKPAAARPAPPVPAANIAAPKPAPEKKVEPPKRPEFKVGEREIGG